MPLALAHPDQRRSAVSGLNTIDRLGIVFLAVIRPR
jgi:hypothetical protein